MPSTPPSSSANTPSANPSSASDHERDADRFFGLSTAQVAGSALAAATSALAASFLGVAGTIIGALVGSLVATVASAVYSQSIRRAGRRLKVLRPVPVSGSASSEPRVVEGPVGPRQGRKWWPRVTLGVVVGAVLALGAITGVEGLMGHPVSDSSRGGTSLGQALSGSSGPSPRHDRGAPPGPSSTTPVSVPSGTATPSSAGGEQPSSTGPAGDPVPAQTPSAPPTTGGPETRAPATSEPASPTGAPTP